MDTTENAAGVPDTVMPLLADVVEVARNTGVNLRNLQVRVAGPVPGPNADASPPDPDNAMDQVRKLELLVRDNHNLVEAIIQAFG